ncbi:hypothetical protein TMES_03110 [Thalassospira mesophila]|uniref:Uncharacterized protein n=1 Tax=Thalassospira mesophila TaxID=1293891 RepID=A0A1Y2L4G8_9PROT|nr:hypothetical protein TMES_03110 [Thalassospira mesophila]
MAGSVIQAPTPFWQEPLPPCASDTVSLASFGRHGIPCLACPKMPRLPFLARHWHGASLKLPYYGVIGWAEISSLSLLRQPTGKKP